MNNAILIQTELLIFCALFGFISAMGLSMFAVGMVRSKNTVVMLCQCCSAFAIAWLSYLTLGHWLLDDPYHLLTPIKSLSHGAPWPVTAELFLQMAPPVLMAVIIAAATAERLKLWAFILFTIIFFSIAYPLIVHHVWEQGWLRKHGFIDIAGSGVWHLSAAVAGLMGSLLLGKRHSKRILGGGRPVMVAANLPLATFGLWWFCLGNLMLIEGFAWLHYETFSLLQFGGILLTGLAAASGGILVMLLLTRLLYATTDITLLLNGAIAGIVSIAAYPFSHSIFLAVLQGAFAATLALGALALFRRIAIDDPMGVIASHGMGGVVGILSVSLVSPKPLLVLLGQQALGLLVLLLGVAGLSLVIWLLIRFLIGLRFDTDAEHRGLDIIECGMNAYPEFTR